MQDVYQNVNVIVTYEGNKEFGYNPAIQIFTADGKQIVYRTYGAYGHEVELEKGEN